MEIFISQNIWELPVEGEIPQESSLKNEPNFTATRVKLSLQTSVSPNMTQEHISQTTNITQNNIIYIHNIENSTSYKEKANIIINNIFQERDVIAKTQNGSRKNSDNSVDINNPIEEISDQNIERAKLHKSSLKEKTVSPKKSLKRVSFNQEVKILNEAENNKNKNSKPSHFSKKMQKKNKCKSFKCF